MFSLYTNINNYSTQNVIYSHNTGHLNDSKINHFRLNSSRNGINYYGIKVYKVLPQNIKKNQAFYSLEEVLNFNLETWAYWFLFCCFLLDGCLFYYCLIYFISIVLCVFYIVFKLYWSKSVNVCKIYTLLIVNKNHCIYYSTFL